MPEERCRAKPATEVLEVSDKRPGMPGLLVVSAVTPQSRAVSGTSGTALTRSQSQDLAQISGCPQRLARAALDAVGDDHDRACRLLLSKLTLAVLDGLPCKVAAMKPGTAVWLPKSTENSSSSEVKLQSVGSFEDGLLLQVEYDRQQPLHLFALDSLEVCIATFPAGKASEANSQEDPESSDCLESKTEPKICEELTSHAEGELQFASDFFASGWELKSDVEAPKVEGLEGCEVRVRSFDPGPIDIPWTCLGHKAFAFLRPVAKRGIVAPRNSLISRRARARAKKGDGEDGPHGEEPQVRTEGQNVSTGAKLSQREGRTPLLAIAPASKRRYKTLSTVGAGAFGTVYLAEEALDETKPGPVPRKVAVKHVRQEGHHSSREAELLAMIQHPCVVTLVDSFLTDGADGEHVSCIVMEYLPENLHQRIAGKPLGASDLRCLSFQLLRALAHLDGLKICHRDVKPENVLLQGRALKLADFGSAKLMGPSPSTSYICSRWWRAPELVLGASNYSTSVDWWSGGCVIAEMMLGQPLFRGASSWGQMYEIIRALGTPTLQDVRALQPVSPGGPGGLCAGRLAGHIARLADLHRPAVAWGVLLPAFAEDHDALALVEGLLVFDPSTRCHPAKMLLKKFFDLLEGPIFAFTDEELSSLCEEDRRQLRQRAGSDGEQKQFDNVPPETGERKAEKEEMHGQHLAKMPKRLVERSPASPRRKRQRCQAKLPGSNPEDSDDIP